MNSTAQPDYFDPERFPGELLNVIAELGILSLSDLAKLAATSKYMQQRIHLSRTFFASSTAPEKRLTFGEASQKLTRSYEIDDSIKSKIFLKDSLSKAIAKKNQERSPNSLGILVGGVSSLFISQFDSYSENKNAYLNGLLCGAAVVSLYMVVDIANRYRKNQSLLRLDDLIAWVLGSFHAAFIGSSAGILASMCGANLNFARLIAAIVPLPTLFLDMPIKPFYKGYGFGGMAGLLFRAIYSVTNTNSSLPVMSGFIYGASIGSATCVATNIAYRHRFFWQGSKEKKLAQVEVSLKQLQEEKQSLTLMAMSKTREDN